MKLSILTVLLMCVFPSANLIAMPLVKRQISMNQATAAANGDIYTVNVSPNQALTISFIRTGQSIKKVWLGNPSKVVMDYDSPLCKDGSASNCGASVIYLRQLAQPLGIDMNLPDGAKGDLTLLTVVTATAESRFLYQFQLALNQPLVYTVLEILPDSAIPKLSPLIPANANIPRLTPLLPYKSPLTPSKPLPTPLLPLKQSPDSNLLSKPSTLPLTTP